MNTHLKNIHLNKTVLASAAVATAALGALGAAAYAWKKHKEAEASNGKSASSAEDGDLSNIGPGEINPYVDTPTDPANQN